MRILPDMSHEKMRLQSLLGKDWIEYIAPFNDGCEPGRPL